MSITFSNVTILGELKLLATLH